MASRVFAKAWPWATGIALAAGLVWLFQNTWPMQVLFIIFGLFTGINIQQLWDPPARWHTKQTLTIETPQGDVSSSVVRGKVMWKEPLLRSSPTEETGEALAIEVSPGRYLFAIVEQRKPDEKALLGLHKGERVWEGVPKLISSKGEPLDIPPDQYPLMVTFGDLKDPTSVQEVDPSNLPATFGPGYKIKSYTVEITDAPITRGALEKVLPWMSTYRGRLKPPSLRLGPGPHNAADVLPIELIENINFVWVIQ